MGQYSKVETDGRLLIVTINRPEVYNALHPIPSCGSPSLPAPATRLSPPATTSSITRS
jgi:hypothetical protein